MGAGLSSFRRPLLVFSPTTEVTNSQSFKYVRNPTHQFSKAVVNVFTNNQSHNQFKHSDV
jgi:hypothetical protein